MFIKVFVELYRHNLKKLNFNCSYIFKQLLIKSWHVQIEIATVCN